MKTKLLILIFFTLSLAMKSQDDNPKAAIIYMNMDKGIHLLYYSNEPHFLYLKKGIPSWYATYEELKKSVVKNEGIELKQNLKDYFDYQLTNYNFFVGQNNNNIDELYGNIVKDFEKEYNISLSNKDEINTLFRKKIKNYNEEELKKFLSKSEIPLLLYSGNYLIKNNKSNFRLHWVTVTETNILNEEYLIKALYFNDKKFNIVKRIRYYFTEILNRHKYLKEGTEFDIDTMMNFVESSIHIHISSSYPLGPISENYKENMIID
ncbi:hypothetical protein [Chryseobacterium sp. CCH4-E10]|uniref:hypothetical protein n=1 Tax=Chryseobacterium sp. CCH4-E10 TaxID=1768758 RepID=UPI000834C873|nr:hypothetical protein [Chryseobacterium sp. CCH4-E10]